MQRFREFIQISCAFPLEWKVRITYARMCLKHVYFKKGIKGLADTISNSGNVMGRLTSTLAFDLTYSQLVLGQCVFTGIVGLL